jgi:hypothetical protein
LLLGAAPAPPDDFVLKEQKFFGSFFQKRTASFGCFPTLTLLTPELASNHPAPYRGYVDMIDGERGVEGWVVNLAAPQQPPVLALRIGGKPVARITPNRERDDISEAVNQRVTAGFKFDAKWLRSPGQPDDAIEVAIDGTDFTLSYAGRDFRVRDLVVTVEAAPAGDVHGAACAVDRLLVVPGFGCFVEGWLLSALRRVEALRLRIGGVTLVARPQGIWRRARTDLLDAFPNAGGLVEQAGFVALFDGDAAPRDASGAVLEVAFDGGGAAEFRVPADVPRLLGHSAGASDALAFFPALANEAFFARFAAAAAMAERAGLALPVVLRAAATPRTLIHVLPEDRSDLFLLFEKLAAVCREDLLDGVTFITAANANRADAPWHVDDLLASFPVPVGVIAVDRAGDAFHLLPDILGMVGAERFVFAAAGLFPAPEGYRLAAEYLRAPARSIGAGPIFLGIEGDGTFPSSRCFGWTVKRFLAWWNTAPAFLGGYYRDNLLARAGKGALHKGVVMAGRKAAIVPIEQAANRVLYEAAIA